MSSQFLAADGLGDFYFAKPFHKKEVESEQKLAATLDAKLREAAQPPAPIQVSESFKRLNISYAGTSYWKTTNKVAFSQTKPTLPPPETSAPESQQEHKKYDPLRSTAFAIGYGRRHKNFRTYLNGNSKR